MGEDTAGLIFHPQDCGLPPIVSRVTVKQYNDKVRFVFQVHHFSKNLEEWITGEQA